MKRRRGGRRDGASASAIPDARDGLTRLERVILVQLARLEKERGGGPVPTAMLYGRVVEAIDVGIDEFQAALTRLAQLCQTQ